MKRLSLFLLAAITPLLVFAADLEDPIFGKYGFANQKSFAAYQQYVGKTVMYLPCEPLSFAESDVFKTQKFVPGAEYVIVSITPQSGTMYSYSSITITFKEKNGKKKLKVSSYTDWAYELPFFFIDDFNEDRESLIGTSFPDPLIKGEYKITDVKLEKPSTNFYSIHNKDRMKVIQYYVSNSAIDRSFVTSDLETTLDIYKKVDKGGSYKAVLDKVEKPEDPTERYGDIQTIVEGGVTKYSFEDELIDIIIFGTSTQFSFKLTNKSQNTIKVIWDDAVYVDYSGSTSKIMHSGIKYNERENSQPASSIIRGASLTDIACPTSNVRYSDVLKEWVTDSMYPTAITKDVKQIRLMLPIQIKDVINEYVFIFNVSYSYDYPDKLNLD